MKWGMMHGNSGAKERKREEREDGTLPGYSLGSFKVEGQVKFERKKSLS